MPSALTRREGFAGQHMVVVPAPLRESARSHPLLQGLLVTDAGYFPSAAGHRVERPQGASTHLLIVCLQGSGWAQSGGRGVQVSAGDVLWLPANQPHAYGAQPIHPWTIVWAHFQGSEAMAWQHELGWDNRSPIGQFRLGPEKVLALGLDEVHANLEAGFSTIHLLSASARLRFVLSQCIELLSSTGASRSAAERTAAVRDEITLKPARKYRLEELATRAGLSVPHFCVLFRQQTGFAPIDYIIRQRIKRACRLLDTTRTTIAAVAAEVGFEDPYYFTRCFHRIMGMSPKSYRSAIKG